MSIQEAGFIYEKWRDVLPRSFAKPRIIGEVVGGLLALAAAYKDIKEAGEDDERLLNNISSTLDQVKDKLDHLENQLDDIVLMLKNLPREIVGRWEAEDYNNLLLRGRATADLVQDKIAGIGMPVIQRELSACLDTLFEIIGEATRRSPASAIANTPGLFAIWLSGQAALQKAAARTEGYRMQSPWDSRLSELLKQTYANYFAQLDKVYAIVLAEKEALPDPQGFVLIVAYAGGYSLRKDPNGNPFRPAEGSLRLEVEGDRIQIFQGGNWQVLDNDPAHQAIVGYHGELSYCNGFFYLYSQYDAKTRKAALAVFDAPPAFITHKS